MFKRLYGGQSKETTKLTEHLPSNTNTSYQKPQSKPNIMKTNMLSAVAFLLLAFTLTSDAVQVKEGTLSFSLEAVQRLQELMDSKAAVQQSPGLQTSSVVSVCADPALPEEFLPLCQQKGASESLSRLARVPMDVCEICAFAACTGC